MTRLGLGAMAGALIVVVACVAWWSTPTARAGQDGSFCQVVAGSESLPGLAVTTTVAKSFQADGVEVPDLGIIPIGSGCARKEVNGAVLVEIVGLPHNESPRITQAIYLLSEVKGK